MRKRLVKKLVNNIGPPPPKRTPLEEALHGMLCKLDDDLTAGMFATDHPLALNSNHPAIRPLLSDSVFAGTDFGIGDERTVFIMTPIVLRSLDTTWRTPFGIIKEAL